MFALLQMLRNNEIVKKTKKNCCIYWNRKLLQMYFTWESLLYNKMK